MKKLIPILLCAVLLVVVAVQYMKLQRLSPPEAFRYELREDIDLDYHNPVAVGAYYEAGRNAEAYAHEMWFSDKTNVRLSESDDPAARAARAHYTRLLAYADSLGARLHRSAQLKSQGYNNGVIRRIEEEGLSPVELRVEEVFGGQRFRKGDRSDGVWALQDLLIREGYEIPHDGNFWEETRTAVSNYQEKSGLTRTGIAGLATLSRLITQNNPQVQ